MDVRTAITSAKKLRPIIDPIGQLPEFLLRLRKAYEVRHPLYGSRPGAGAARALSAASASVSSSTAAEGDAERRPSVGSKAVARK